MEGLMTFDPLSTIPVQALRASAAAITAATGPAKERRQTEAFSSAETGEEKASTVARDQLRAFVERIERLEEEKATIADDIKDVYGEAKAMGFRPKILRKVIAIRKKSEDERMEEDAILDTYLHALGMIESQEG
jgi:uncharacterized protein (UPF0335 family)